MVGLCNEYRENRGNIYENGFLILQAPEEECDKHLLSRERKMRKARRVNFGLFNLAN